MSQEPPNHQAPANAAAPVAPLGSEQRTELALRRAAAADAWRAYVESGALIHRQRGQFLETQFILALQRERRAGDEIARLNWVVEEWAKKHATLVGQYADLDAEYARLHARYTELANWLQELEAMSLRDSMAYVLRRSLHRSRLGALLRAVKQRFGPGAPEGRADTPAEAGPPAAESEAAMPAEAAAAAIAVAGNEAPALEAEAETVAGAPVAAAPLLHPGGRCADPKRKTVLFITVHADDTPLGRYALDLADTLASYCNIIVWQLGDGRLLSAFQAAACGFVADGEPRHDYAHARRFIFGLLDQNPDISLAIVAGGELKTPLPALGERYVPVIGLVEEQIVYASSLYSFEEVLYWNTHTFFTNASAHRAVRRIYPYVNPDSISVMVPGPGARSTPRMTTQGPDDTLLPPSLRRGAPGAHDVLVLGWGPLTYDGGADLFLAVADAMLRAAPGKRYRYAWLAQPATDALDAPYPLAIQTQIERMGLQDQISIIVEPLSNKVSIGHVDLVLYTARNDTLQHNAVQALECGLPVLAFTGMTTLADAMESRGLAADCLARPGDAHELANKALALLADDGRRQALSERLKALDWQAHTLDGYVRAMLEKAAALEAIVRQECTDEALLRESGRLRPDYMGVVIDHAEQLECSDARLYVRGWKAGIGSRKPRPGFSPAIYARAAMMPESLEDPYAHYLRSGSPAGPWLHPVIEPLGGNTAPLPGLPAKAALHIHAYYPDMLEELLDRIALNASRPDLFISVKDEASRGQAAALLERYPGRVAAIEVVPNRGRDIGPFLATFGRALVDGYELIGHLHTKRSPHADRLIVERWRNFLMENLLGGQASGNMMDSILSAMATHPEWAIAFPDDPIPLGWDTNRACAEAIAQHLMPGELPEHFSFPAGTMFWIRAEALRPFVELGLGYDDYPVEPLPVDGTLLHALERLFGVVPRARGMECAVTSVPGVSR